MVECFTLCNTICITCLWCSLLFPFCFPKYFHKLEKKNSSEFCIQRMKCKEKVSKILRRCRSRENSQSYSQSEKSNSSRNRKDVKETSTDKKCINNFSGDEIMNGMGENNINRCMCRNCLGYEYGCQNLSHNAKMTSISKNRNDLNNNKSHQKYRLYAKLTKDSGNSREKFLHLKYKWDENNQDHRNSVSSPNMCQCSSKNNQACNHCS